MMQKMQKNRIILHPIRGFDHAASLGDAVDNRRFDAGAATESFFLQPAQKLLRESR